MMKSLDIACLVSGSGTNLQAIIDRIETGALDVRIAAVISNVPGAYAIERARKHGIPAFTVDHKQYARREDFEQALIDVIDDKQAKLVCLCGFMRIFTPAFIAHYPNRIINIHPALLPDFGGKGFYGRHVHEAVLKSGVKTSGCTVHIVDDQPDHGPIILQKTVPVLPGDTAETLAARVLEQEHVAFSEAIQLFAHDRVEIKNGLAVIKPL
ncbi:MAG: phosphoribosylglycinamide formyltransferase [Candidatus Edwardsbacteria bacterium]|nr:phosphoribosylglycinamide formyltransferase [Candidatus Edwardsbacteria bacterium]